MRRSASRPRADSHPGELIIIDHTKIDTYTLFDTTTGLPLGKLTLTVAIDVFTRMVVGFLISAEPPSLYSITTVIKRICRNKDYVKTLYPDIEGTWDAWCLPGEILVDNGLEFISPSFQDAMEDVGVNVTWAPIHTPQYKAIGERFFHTLNKMLFHKLKGATAQNAQDLRRIGLTPYKDAVITWDACDELVHQSIIEVYHRNVHSTINAQPARMWSEGIAKNKIRMINDMSMIDKLVGNVATVKLTRNGVRFKNMVFHDRELVSIALNDMARHEAKRTQSDRTYSSAAVNIKIKYNPADCSKIEAFIEGEDRNYYATLWNRDVNYSDGISFWHAEQIRNYALAKNLEFQSDEDRWRARDRLRLASERFALSGRRDSAARTRRIMAQARPTLEDGEVIEVTSDGEVLESTSYIPVAPPGMTRVDAGKVTKGVRRGGKKASEKAAKARRENAAHESGDHIDEPAGRPSSDASAPPKKRFKIKGNEP